MLDPFVRHCGVQLFPDEATEAQVFTKHRHFVHYLVQVFNALLSKISDHLDVKLDCVVVNCAAFDLVIFIFFEAKDHISLVHLGWRFEEDETDGGGFGWLVAESNWGK